MSDRGREHGTLSEAAEYDAVIVGASLAGCATAMFLGRSGAKVALVEKRPDPAAFKRLCTHFIQASGVPTLERLEPAGADRGGRGDSPPCPDLEPVGMGRRAAGAVGPRGQPAS